MVERALKNLVNGQAVDAIDGATLELVDPSTGEVFADSPNSGPNDVDAACRAAADAFDGWRDTTPAQRQLALLKFADLVEQHGEEIVALECENTGKPIGLTADEELPPMVDQIRFFAGAARILEGTSAGEYMEGHTSWIRREPVGVCAQVTPWNYPMMMAIWKIAPALAAGNTIVLKPSDTTPLSTVRLGELGAEVFPPGVFNVICGDRSTGAALVSHPIPDMVSITGSVRAGMEVMRSAADDLKNIHLELGGKAPVIVFNDADVEAAAEAIAGAGYFNAGQDCTAATRVIAQAGVAAELAEALAAQARQTTTDGPGNPAADYGPLNNANQLERVAGLVSRAPAHSEVLTGGSQVGDKGYFFAPTVISGMRQDDEMIQNEIFGPVITVQSFDDEAEALRLANGVKYGLASSVFTTDHATAMRVSRRLDFGCVWINTHIPIVAEMPHGGFKHSGTGKDLSKYGFEDYTRIKHVMSAF